MFENPTDETLRHVLSTAKTIAIVGLSDKPHRDSYEVASYLQRAGYRIIPVNPAIKEVLGEPSVTSLDDLATDVDIINVFRRSDALLDLVHDASKLSAPVIWAQLGVEDETAAQEAQSAGKTVVMDRCIKIEHHRLM